MERSRFNGGLSIDLHSECDRSVYFGHGVVIYFIMQSLHEKSSKKLPHFSSKEIAICHLLFISSLEPLGSLEAYSIGMLRCHLPVHHFQTSPTLLGHSKPNFMWSLHGSGE